MRNWKRGDGMRRKRGIIDGNTGMDGRNGNNRWWRLDGIGVFGTLSRR